MLFKFKKVSTLLCSFCKTIAKTFVIHLFHECQIANQLCGQIRFSFEDEFNFPRQSAIFGLTGFTENVSLINRLLLAFKFCGYSAKEKKANEYLTTKIFHQ